MFASSVISQAIVASAMLMMLLTAAHVIRVLIRPISRIPGPWYSKWTSGVIKYHWLRGRRAYHVHQLHLEYGPIVRLSPNEVSIIDIESVKSVYSSKELFVKSRFYTDVATSEDETVFSTPNVKYHRHIRKLLGSSMTESSIKRFEATVVSNFDIGIQRMEEEISQRGATDILRWWAFTATDVIGELSFGDSFRTLQTGQRSDYTELLAKIAPMAGLAAIFPWIFDRMGNLPIPFIKERRISSDKMRAYAAESLRRYQRLLDSGSDHAQQTLFTKIMHAKKAGTVSDLELRDSAMAYIVAGSDTTANTLTYLVWAVCKHPKIKAGLVEELQSLPDNFTDMDLRKLQLLDYIISETLRLYSAAPSALPRVVPYGGASIGDYWVSGGTVVSTQAYSMHRKHEIFPNPDSFIPSRWSKVTREMKDAYMPYGRAARVCLGQHLANTELRHGAARFFRHFPHAQVSSMNGMTDEGMRPDIYFLIAPSGRQCLIEPGC